MTEINDQLVKHIDEAYAMEQNVLRMLDSMIETTEDPEMRSHLEEHKRETEIQAARLEERLQAHGESPSVVREAGGVVTDWSGDEEAWLSSGDILAAPPAVHKVLLDVALGE